MPTTAITIRLDDDRRQQLESSARLYGRTVSEAVRDAIDVYLGRDTSDEGRPADSDSPHTLSVVDRRTMSLLFDVLAKVSTDEDERDNYAKRRNALSEGHTGLYGQAFTDIYPEMPYADCRLVWDILDMHRVLVFSWRELDTDDDMPRWLQFRGFDGNDSRESRMLSFTERLLDDGKYSEQRERFENELDRGNSHMPTLGIYERMLRAFDPIWNRRLGGAGTYLLSREEIDTVLAAAPYPRSRTAED